MFKWKRQAEAVEPGTLARVPDAEHRNQGNGWPEGELRRPSDLECRPGMIEINLPDRVRGRVDAFVDARALGRVLSALKRHA